MGAPHGSILRRLFFNVFIDDIFHIIEKCLIIIMQMIIPLLILKKNS